MARYKKAKTMEIPEIAPDQMEVQDDEGNILVIAIANFPDHQRLGFIAVPGTAPLGIPEPDPVVVNDPVIADSGAPSAAAFE